jgi:hypothetical protein
VKAHQEYYLAMQQRHFFFALVTSQFSDPDVLWQLGNLLMEIPPEEIIPWINSH